MELLRMSNRLNFTAKDAKFRHMMQRSGAMPSGVSDVTARNSTNNVVGMVMVMLCLGFTADDILKSVRIILLGDDNVWVIHSRLRRQFDVATVQAIYKDNFSWNAKVKLYEREDVAMVEFCSCYWPLNKKTGKYAFSPKPGRVLAKTFHLEPHLPDKNVIFRGILRGQGHYETGYILSHVLQILDVEMGDTKKMTKVIELEDWATHHQYHYADIKVTEDNLDTDCERYGVSKDQIHDFLRSVQVQARQIKVGFEPLVLKDHFVLGRMLIVDHSISEDDYLASRVDEGVRSITRATAIYRYLYYQGIASARVMYRELRETLEGVEVVGPFMDPPLG